MVGHLPLLDLSGLPEAPSEDDLLGQSLPPVARVPSPLQAEWPTDNALASLSPLDAPMMQGNEYVLNDADILFALEEAAISGGVTAVTTGGIVVPMSTTDGATVSTTDGATAMCGVVPTPQPEMSVVSVSTKPVRRATTTVAAKANKPHSHQLGIALSKPTTSRKVPNHASTANRLRDAVWSEDVLSMPAAKLNEWLASRALSAEQEKELKAARRRHQDRLSQKRYRAKRNQKQSAREQEHSALKQELSAVKQENNELQRGYNELQRRYDELVAYVNSLVRGGMVAASDVPGLV